VGAKDTLAEYYKKNPWVPQEILNGKGGWKRENFPPRQKKKEEALMPRDEASLG
jgi:hypothetical protein